MNMLDLVAPKNIRDELVRLVRLDRRWCRAEELDERKFACNLMHGTGLVIKNAVNAMGLTLTSRWLVDGPKAFLPTAEQQQVLSRIEIPIPPSEFSQPYPELFVGLDIPPYTGALCGEVDGMLVLSLFDPTRKDDITSIMKRSNHETMDVIIQTYDDDCQELSTPAHRALRIVINSCLALSSFGCHLDYLRPRDVESDRRLASGPPSERRERARGRLALAVQVASFDRDVWARTVESVHPGEPTGRQMPPHFRRAHWAMQPFGPKGSLRKRILRPFTFVRKDLFIGDTADTRTTYHG